MSASEVADFYNQLNNEKKDDRQGSRIVTMRNFNNWIKSMIIQEATGLIKDAESGPPRLIVLDMCAGKGGDLLKWQRGPIDEVIMVDIAETSVQQAQARYNESRNRPNSHTQFGAQFIALDLTEANLFPKLRRPMFFDLVSCQFALHYAFRDEAALRRMLYNASGRMRTGGYFIGTYPNAERIVHLLRKTTDGKYKNDVLTIEYLDKSVKNWSTLTPPLFGARIFFSLEERVNCAEFLLYFPLLVEIAKEFDLELVSNKSFPQCIDHFDKQDQRQLMSRIKALEEIPIDEDKLANIKENLHGAKRYPIEYAHAEKKRRELQGQVDRRGVPCLGTLTKSEWETIALYDAFIFRKTDTPTVKTEE
uniref:mRNA cap guanine-N(7) methyltransferase n=1 Tax=Panagrellus redivivus TaxID=6233 RepID=A0A7E4ZTL4_PANRE